MDRDREVVAVARGAGRGTTLVAWLALILAIVALTIAWMAYDRTGDDLENRIQEQVQQSAQDVNQGVQNGADALDAGPDGVDEDDTDVNASGGADTNTNTTPDTTTNN